LRRARPSSEGFWKRENRVSQRNWIGIVSTYILLTWFSHQDCRAELCRTAEGLGEEYSGGRCKSWRPDVAKQRPLTGRHSGSRRTVPFYRDTANSIGVATSDMPQRHCSRGKSCSRGRSRDIAAHAFLSYSQILVTAVGSQAAALG
jgi:hypothetical protein